MGTLLTQADPKGAKAVKAKLGFITPTFMTVLEFFMENPMQGFHEREVVRQTGVSKGSAGKILKLLTSLGFLGREEKGTMAIYTLNLKDPSVRQFKILVNTFALKGLINALKDSSRKVVLFGSCSQGTDTKDSDIDLLVVSQEKSSVKKAISKFNQEAARRVAPIIVEANEFVLLRKEDKPLFENIQRGIALWEAE